MKRRRISMYVGGGDMPSYERKGNGGRVSN
jgi:hypothetical protein